MLIIFQLTWFFLFFLFKPFIFVVKNEQKMNYTTILRFLEERGFECKWEQTAEIDGKFEHLDITLEKENVATIDIDCNDTKIRSIKIEPHKNHFNWDENEGAIDDESDNPTIYLKQEHLYLLEYVLDLIENDDTWSNHIEEYDKMVKLFRDESKKYKEIFKNFGYKTQKINYGSTNEIFIRTVEFFNRPYSLSYFCLKLDCLLLKITLECQTDLGTSTFAVPFDSYYAEETINKIVHTDNLWKPIMIENEKKMKMGVL